MVSNRIYIFNAVGIWITPRAIGLGMVEWKLIVKSRQKRRCTIVYMEMPVASDKLLLITSVLKKSGHQFLKDMSILTKETRPAYNQIKKISLLWSTFLVSLFK